MRPLPFVILIVFLSTLIGMPTHSLAYSTSSHGWGYKKSTDHQAPDAGVYGGLVEKYGGFYVDPTDEKVVYLTFDNGYEKGYTGKVLDILKKKEVPATFFITGHYINSAPDLVKRMVREGHIVGNHSWSHPDFASMNETRIKDELQKVEKAVADLTEQESMMYLRPPRGTFSEKSLAVTENLGYVTMFWSLAFVDWHTDAQKGWEYAYRSVMNQIHPGAVILLHTVSQDNAEALEKMIDEMRKQGYTFKSLDDLVMKRLLPNPISEHFGL